MKSILISIRPEWVAKILNKEKTIEIRKTFPNCDLPIDVYIYCTKVKNDIALNMARSLFGEPKNGKVVAKFRLKRIDKIDWNNLGRFAKMPTCLTEKELEGYLRRNGFNGYAWHISDIELIEEIRGGEWEVGKDLSDFGLKRAPQSWQYVEAGE